MNQDLHVVLMKDFAMYILKSLTTIADNEANFDEKNVKNGYYCLFYVFYNSISEKSLFTSADYVDFDIVDIVLSSVGCFYF